jgi:hypothetical protein
MRRTISRRSPAVVAPALVTVLLLAGCGDVEVKAKGADKSAEETPSASPSTSQDVDTRAGEGNWLLGMTTAGGDDGETSSTVYITLNPSTGQATAHQLPGVRAASASPDQAALLVSADRRWAIPDTGIGRTEEKSGKPKLYSLTDGSPTVVDIRQRTGRSDVDPIGWAFDPTRADTLRVVDTKNRVWAVNVAGGKATQEGSLPKGPWVFTNGFNRNTGQPWVESISSDTTQPPGNGPTDTSPVTRSGGTVLPAGSPGFAKLPANPCRLGAGFTDSAGVTWAFCADSAAVTTHYLPKDATTWTAYGKSSTAVAPAAAGVSLVLPPAE